MSKIISALLIALLILGIPLVLLFVILTQPAQGSIPINDCPAGSYNIGASKNGEVICKLEPTGCPYGDSIPLGPDCDKHKPAEPQAVQPAPEPIVEEPIEYGGK